MSSRFVGLSVALVAGTVAFVAPLVGSGPSFQPDGTFQGSALTGWHQLGAAQWRAQNGELTGTPTQPGGGWLVLDTSYQDVGLYASFRCTGGCKTGVLLRAERTPDGGLKGVYYALVDGDVASYAVTIDASGQETSRTALRPGGGQMRIAPPLDLNAAVGRGAAAGRGVGGRAAGPAPTLPLTSPNAALRANEWNDVEILIDANIVRGFLNNGREVGGGVAEDAAGRAGPLALYVGGSGMVQFKDVAYKDLAAKTRAPERLSSRFRMQQLTDFYYAWGAGAADINHDGVLDVVSGPHVFLGPSYTTRREIYAQLTSNPSDTYTTDDWMQFTADFTADGWPDVINASFSQNVGVWLYVNPKGEKRRWDKHLVVPQYQSEIGVLRDVDADGQPELVYMGGGMVRYAEPDPAHPTGPWIVYDVSAAGYGTAHGIGTGDVNGDGRLDIVNAYGWYEQPASKGLEPWIYHSQAFARYGRNIMGGSVMAVYDVNGDRLNDVVTVLNVHGWGFAWFEQTRDASGGISFVPHMIMDDFSTKNAGGVTFSQAHGTNVADMDGDGIPDFVIGKRFWSHRDDYLDPDPYGDPVLYWYRTVRNPRAPGGAEFVPQFVHNRSGVGSDVLPVDLNQDGRMDLVSATRFGTFIFFAQPGAAGR